MSRLYVTLIDDGVWCLTRAIWISEEDCTSQKRLHSTALSGSRAVPARVSALLTADAQVAGQQT